MDFSSLLLALTAISLFLSSPTSAQSRSPPAPILPPSPAPAPAPGPAYANLTYLFQYTGPFHTFLNYLEQTNVLETFQNQANNTKQGITIFVPRDSAFSSLNKSDLANLTNEQIKTLLLYHAFPQFYSLSDFKTVANPVSTLAGGQYTLNVTTQSSGVIHAISSWSSSKVVSSVYTTKPVALYEVDKVLLPLQIFSTDPPLVPAPAPAPESGKTSDLAPGKDGAGSSPKSSESATGNHSYRAGVSVLNCLALALALTAALMLTL